MLQVHGWLYWPKCYRSMVGCIGPNATGPWSAVLAQMLQVHGQLCWPKCNRSMEAVLAQMLQVDGSCIGLNVTDLWSAVFALVKGPWLAVLAQMLPVHGWLYWPNCYRFMVGCIGPIVTGPWLAVLAQLLQANCWLY